MALIQWKEISPNLETSGNLTGSLYLSGSQTIYGDLSINNNATIGNNATISGNLKVYGDLTYLSTTNTAIKDKFILLNSGSIDIEEGGFIIDEGDGVGHGLIFDNSDLRFGVNKSVDSKVNNITSNEAYLALVVDDNNTDHNINDNEYQKRGNIRVDSSDNIYIWA